MPLRALTLAASLLSVALFAGCATAPASYQARLSLRDLESATAGVENGYRLVSSTPSSGRFACALAVARFEPDGSGGLRLAESLPAEQAALVEGLRGMRAIRGVEFVSPIVIRPAEASVDNLCDAAGRLNARLLLRYVVNRYGPNAGQVLGVLHAVDGGQVLATLHAGERHLEPTDDGPREIDPDPRPAPTHPPDARHDATRAFEAQLRLCLAELAARDRGATAEPHDWTPQPGPQWWVPERYQQIPR